MIRNENRNGAETRVEDQLVGGPGDVDGPSLIAAKRLAPVRDAPIINYNDIALLIGIDSSVLPRERANRPHYLG